MMHNCRANVNGAIFAWGGLGLGFLADERLDMNLFLLATWAWLQSETPG